jgi:hypothetical protein
MKNYLFILAIVLCAVPTLARDNEKIGDNSPPLSGKTELYDRTESTDMYERKESTAAFTISPQKTSPKIRHKKKLKIKTPKNTND